MKKDEMQILAGTNNAGKIKELKELLEEFPVRLRSLGEFENIIEPEETGRTFIENAVIKAVSYAKQTGLATLADDSGLEVEALGGAPGVFSARYGGSGASSAEKISKLLCEIKASNNENRTARFVCAMVLTDKTGKIIFQAQGICGGTIALDPKGQNGFGYDPVFIPEDFDRTFGEISGEIKSKFSHRARAIEKIIRFLRDKSAV